MNQTVIAELLVISCETTSRLAVDALRMSGRQMTDKTITRMLTTAPRDETDVTSLEFFEDSFCCRFLTDAWRTVSQQGTTADKAQFRQVRHHFLEVVPGLSPQARQLLERAFRGTMSGLRYAEEFSRDGDDDHSGGVPR